MKWYIKAIITGALIEAITMLLLPISLTADSITGMAIWLLLHFPGFQLCLLLGINPNPFMAMIPSLFIWILLSMLVFGIKHRRAVTSDNHHFKADV